MKCVLTVLGVFAISLAISQNIRLSSGIGYTIAEAKNEKKVMLNTATSISYELKFKWDLSIAFSPGVSTIRHSSTDANLINSFHNISYINMPLSFRKYFFVSKKSKVFMDAGINAGWFFLHKIELRDGLNIQRERQKNVGWNFGTCSAVGFKTVLSKKIFFEIGFSRIDDLFTKYRNQQDELKLKTNMLYTGFSIEL